MLEIKHLTKVYPNGVKALDNIQLQIGKGMFGLLGPNGAGKSTLMRTIATLQKPDSGTVHFNGINIWEETMQLRKWLGYLPQEFGVYPNISAEKLLDYFALLKGVSSKKERQQLVGEALEITNLYEVRKKKVDSYSGGMKQRFGIAQLLLNNPQLIIVDEPTAGLDPAERNRFLNILREIGMDHTVIFSTHIVEDVRELCTQLAIMDKGQILKQRGPEEATKEIKGKIWKKTIVRADLEQTQKDFTILSTRFNLDHSLRIKVFSNTPPGEGFSPAEPDLEDVYFVSLQRLS